MKTVIIDASIGVKWFFEEIDSEKAETILQQTAEAELKLLVPELFFYEIANVVISKKQSKSIKEIQQALTLLHFDIYELGLSFIDKIVNIANIYTLSFYDACYVTVLKETNYEFITADKRLFDKIKKHFPQAKLLS